MQQSKYLVCAALAAASVIAIANSGIAHADEEYIPKAKVTTLHQGPLAGVEGKEVIIKHFALPPEFVGGRHYHPGPVFVYVLKGELTVQTDDGTATYKAGEIYPEPLEKPMQGRNLSAFDTAELVVFQIGEIGKPMMIKVD